MILDDGFDQALGELNNEDQKTIYNIGDVEKICNEILATIPKIDRNSIRKEMSHMYVKVSENPTTFQLNEGLAKVQGYKDRLSEIHNLANTEYKLRKRTLEMLFDAYSVISKAPNAEKRRGEATMKYPLMVINLEASEIFIEEVEQIMSNMKSTSEILSRQVSVFQLQLQLGERRGKSQSNSEAEEINYASKKSGEVDWDDF